MIDDDELRSLFKAESEEYLSHIEQGLLRLEQNPGDQETVQGLFRDAHSLKGSARMLGLSEVELLAHAFEELLRAAQADGGQFQAAGVPARFFAIFDALRRLVDEAVNGVPCDLDVAAFLTEAGVPVVIKAMETTEAGSEGGAVEESPALPDQPEECLVGRFARNAPDAGDDVQSKPAPAGATSSVPPPPDIRASRTRAETSHPSAGEYRIETIRVRTRELDRLITLVGELMVAGGRNATRLENVDEVISCWEVNQRQAQALSGSGKEEMRQPASRGNGRQALDDDRIEAAGRMAGLLGCLRAAVNEDGVRLFSLAKEIEGRVRAIRMLPMSTVFDLFPRLVRDLAKQEGKEVQLVIEGRETAADKLIIEEIKDPLMHMIRNAIDHGIESAAERQRLGKPAVGAVFLRASHTADHILVEVEDDGRGMDPEKIKNAALQRRLYSAEELAVMSPSQLRALVFLSGLSTASFVTDVSGRGVGLDVVRSRVERLKGSVVLEANPGQGCRVRLRLPSTLATTRVVVVKANGWKYALPAEHVRRMMQVRVEEIFTVKGRDAIVLDGAPLPVAGLADLLQLPAGITTGAGSGKKTATSLLLVVLNVGEQSLAVAVDEMLDEQEVVSKPAGALLKRVRNVSGATILGTGEVCFILNPFDLFLTVQKAASMAPAAGQAAEEEAAAERPGLILYAEDSMTTRTQMKRILESGGYEVETAVDGLEALEKMSSRNFDALVSDIMMPNMDGFELTSRIRADTRYQELPIVLVTTLDKDADRRRGLEVGANAYITKGAFDQTVLLDTLRRLI